MNIEKYLSKFRVGNPNKNHALADQIFQSFRKRISFPRIMKIITTHGHQFVYEIWNEIRQGDCINPVALFLWKVKQNKIELK